MLTRLPLSQKRMNKLELIITSDGSHSLLNTVLDETYHSRHGAMQESVHVFIQQGLQFFLDQKQREKVSVLEIGFGTGLNALLTAQHAQSKSYSIQYVSLEAFPVEETIWSKLNYADTDEAKDLFRTLHQAQWTSPELIGPNFTLIKAHTTLQQVDLSQYTFDVVYYDAFAPNKQPEMWELPLLQKVVERLSGDGVFVTYCAKGQLKRDLRSLGLNVETLPGPPGKKEMIRAMKFRVSGSAFQVGKGS
jgi:tRNA U34 5-methylaminomethyl-2-thiouridine-forming methyltransferase MnmC